MNSKPQFISSYMGETNYLIDGIRYTKRYEASSYERSICNPSVFERECLPFVGTVRGEFEQFPSDDIMRHFPGYVPARWNPQTNKVETKGKPKIIDHPPFAPWAERISQRHADEMKELFEPSAING